MISYVQFLNDVSGLGSSWSIDKHGKDWSIEERGSWIVVTHKTHGIRRRVPITSVGAIHETGEDKPTNSKVKV